MNTLLLLYMGGGILSMLISLPLLFEKIKPNLFYGFRIRATLEDPAVWYAVNKFFAWRLFLVGVSIALAAAGLYWIPGIGIDTYAIGVLVVLVIGFSTAMRQSWVYMRSLTQKDDR